MGKINVRLPHITDEIFYSESLRAIYLPKIVSKVRLCTIRKDIHDGMILWVYKNALIFTCTGVSFEFINRNSFFERRTGIMDAVKYSADGCDRNIGCFSYRF